VVELVEKAEACPMLCRLGVRVHVEHQDPHGVARVRGRPGQQARTVGITRFHEVGEVRLHHGS
jgi:hypothetical protein